MLLRLIWAFLFAMAFLKLYIKALEKKGKYQIRKHCVVQLHQTVNVGACGLNNMQQNACLDHSSVRDWQKRKWA